MDKKGIYDIIQKRTESEDVLQAKTLTKVVLPETKENIGVPSLQLWDAEVIEGASVGTFQGQIPKGEKRFGRYEWGHVYSPVRIACFIPSLWPDKSWVFDLLIMVYGRLCDLFRIVICENENPPKNDTRLLIVACDSGQSAKER